MHFKYHVPFSMLLFESRPAVLHALGVNGRIIRIDEIHRVIYGEVLIRLWEVGNVEVRLPQVGNDGRVGKNVLLDDRQQCGSVSQIDGYEEALGGITADDSAEYPLTVIFAHTATIVLASSKESLVNLHHHARSTDANWICDEILAAHVAEVLLPVDPGVLTELLLRPRPSLEVDLGIQRIAAAPIVAELVNLKEVVLKMH